MFTHTEKQKQAVINHIIWLHMAVYNQLNAIKDVFRRGVKMAS